MERKAAITWPDISNHIPSHPSVRTLQRKWKELGMPIKKDRITRKNFAYIDDLNDWVKRNQEKI